MAQELMRVDEAKSIAEVMIASGYFKDVKDVAQATVKILMGHELGVAPFAALRGIDLVEGNIQIRAHLMAAMIKKSGRYDYRVVSSDETACAITYWDVSQDAQLGQYVYTMEDAKLAGLVDRKDRYGKSFVTTWQKFPKMMLYNRCMSMGAKMYCPDIFLGAVYEPGEIEAPRPEPDSPKPEAEAIAVEAEAVSVNDTELSFDAAVGNLFGDDPPPPEPSKWGASPKQIGYLCSLLKERGVWDGDKKALIAVVLGAEPERELVSKEIDSLVGTEILTPLWLNSYVRCLREVHGVSQDDVITHLDVAFNARVPADLTGLQQAELIGWIKAQPIPEEIDLVSASERAAIAAIEANTLRQDWRVFVEELSVQTEFPVPEIEAWILLQAESDWTSVAELSREIFDRFKSMGSLAIRNMMRLGGSEAESLPDMWRGYLTSLRQKTGHSVERLDAWMMANHTALGDYSHIAAAPRAVYDHFRALGVVHINRMVTQGEVELADDIPEIFGTPVFVRSVVPFSVSD